ncbi:MAG: hypothetical protein PUP93_18185 [Rhizonema sp. NSF051]|nr:hypothetical protein [Rhizonema sp. NSF051]
MQTEIVAEYNVVLCVGDTTFLEYDGIVAKKEGYGPIGKGGNGLILHSAVFEQTYKWSINRSIVAKIVEPLTKAEATRK